MKINGTSILITGGTGSLGQALVKYFIEKNYKLKRLIIFSRDEQKQYNMEKEFSEKKYPFMRYFIGDVRNYERLNLAFKNVDCVIHAAAMKHVHIAEYNPTECLETNVDGAKNIISAALSNNVRNIVSLSTDKACSPSNLYGASKLVSDKLFVAANNITGKQDVKFSVVRYGNVMGSNGSVIPYFIKLNETSDYFPITHPKMTRFNISIEGGVEMVIHALKNAIGGEIFIPKIPSYNILDVAKAINENKSIKVIGIRPGEKLHEEMISKSDSLNTYDFGKYYVILPSTPKFNLDVYLTNEKCKKVEEGFSYDSETNLEWENVESLRKLIKKHIS